jgi:hypothetical protein
VNNLKQHGQEQMKDKIGKEQLEVDDALSCE